ncbi:MAG TPA: hypothetical protein ENI79_02405 [Rhodospirillales bacterium]|nr:hypothetical protein [Rhodospirillales bacterium]
MIILGVIGRSDVDDAHDAAACLIRDGRLIAAMEQERVSRRRHAPGESPAAAIDCCLDIAGIEPDTIDAIAYGWLEDRLGDEAVEITPYIHCAAAHHGPILGNSRLANAAPLPPIHFVSHHAAHMAAAYYTSGFDHAAGLIVDGQGENDSITLFEGRNGYIRRLESYPVGYSLGLYYETAAAYCGLGWDAAGKLMGLAAYGHAEASPDFGYCPNTGRFRLPPELAATIDTEDAQIHVCNWQKRFNVANFPYTSGEAGHHFLHIHFAAEAQATLEAIALNLTCRLKRLTDAPNLLLGGGCALNCCMNSRLAREAGFDDIYAFPAANDAGAAVGAALALSYSLSDGVWTPPPRLVAPDLGVAYDEAAIASELEQQGMIGTPLGSEKLAEAAADLLARDAILMLFNGRDEFGPRALGRRSFVASPAKREITDRLNRIKGREIWRPIAPSILADEADKVLMEAAVPGLDRYMLGVATVRQSWRSCVPAVVHIDGTTRPHLVVETDEFYWSMIKAFYRRTGVPMVCNTSLNIRGEPIIHTPKQAIEMFLEQPDVDGLIVGQYLLTRDGLSTA